MQILLVEDDSSLALGLSQALRPAGYSVNHVAHGKAAILAVQTGSPDIVILDLGLPDMDGLEVLKVIRSRDVTLPVLILSARTELHNKVEGLDKGADDYLTKPFEMAELFARLRVISRHASTSHSNIISIGSVELNTTANTLQCAGNQLDVSRRELMVMKALMEAAGTVLTRDALESKLYSWGEEVSSNTIEVHIHHLRKKLGGSVIKTIRGVGYTVVKS